MNDLETEAYILFGRFLDEFNNKAEALDNIVANKLDGCSLRIFSHNMPFVEQNDEDISQVLKAEIIAKYSNEIKRLNELAQVYNSNKINIYKNAKKGNFDMIRDLCQETREIVREEIQ